MYVDPDSLITTPYDMMINQIAEEFRADQKHGSCGVGFAETIERNLHPAFSLRVADIENTPKIIDTLQLIRKKWLPQRLKSLHIPSIPERWQAYIASDDIFELYRAHLSLFLQSITVNRLDLTKTARPIIFEGAQGLMLDQARGWFPHVTRSHTGLKNVLRLIEGKVPKNLNVIYVTRSYLTRHGAGPLPYELPTLPYKKVLDQTNTTNVHQGALRYAWFNVTLLKSFIQSDLKGVPASVHVHPHLAVTCLDQVDDKISFVDGTKICKASQAEFLHHISKKLKINELLCSYGPTPDTIETG